MTKKTWDVINERSLSLKVKVIGSNPGYLLKSFLLYCSSIIKQDSFSMNVVHCTRDARELRCIKCLFALEALVE